MRIDTQIGETQVISEGETVMSSVYNAWHKVTVGERVVFSVRNRDSTLRILEFRDQHNRLVRQLRLGLQFSLDEDVIRSDGFEDLIRDKASIEEIIARLESFARAGHSVDHLGFVNAVRNTRVVVEGHVRERIISACYRGFDTTPSIEAAGSYKFVLQWVRS